jgi:hypothetical protein
LGTIVDHLEARILPLIEQAAARRAERERAAEPLEGKPTPKPPREGFDKWVHEPNPWVLGIGATVIGAIIVAILFAIF